MEEPSDNQEDAVPAIFVENEEDGLSSATGFENSILDDTTEQTYHDNEECSQETIHQELPTTEVAEIVQTEMTFQEKQDMYAAVKSGDIDAFEDLLDKPCADMHMIWFRENLLMIALRAKKQPMAEFLIDNGIDYNFETSFIEAHDVAKQKKRLDCYTTSCRQLAYDNSLFEVVELIDTKNNQLFRGMLPRVRVPRMRRPPPVTPDPVEYVEEVAHDSIEEQKEEVDDSVDASNADNLTVSNFEDRCDSELSSVYGDNHNEQNEDTIDSDNDGDSMVEEIVPTESEIAAKEYIAIMESLKCARYLQRIHFQRSRTMIDKASTVAGDADDGYGTSSPNSCHTSPTSKYSRTGRQELPRHATKASIMLKRQTDLLIHRDNANFKHLMITSELTKSCLFNEDDTRWRRSKKRNENNQAETVIKENVIELQLDPVRTQSPWHEDKPLHPARLKLRYSRSKSAETRPHTTDGVRTMSKVIFNLNVYQNSSSYGTRFPLLPRQTVSRACSLPSRKSCARIPPKLPPGNQ